MSIHSAAIVLSSLLNAAWLRLQVKMNDWQWVKKMIETRGKDQRKRQEDVRPTRLKNGSPHSF